MWCDDFQSVNEQTNKRMNWMNKFYIVCMTMIIYDWKYNNFLYSNKMLLFFCFAHPCMNVKKKNSIMILSTETGREKRKRFYGMTRWSRWYCSRNNRRNEWKESIWILSLSLYVFPLEFYSKISLFKSCMWII